MDTKKTTRRCGLRFAIFSFLVTLAMVLMTLPLLAQGTNAPPVAGAPAASGLAISTTQLLIAFGVPLIIAVIKFFVPKIPGGLLPYLAPVLGTIADAITSYATGHAMSPVTGALLGSAGVGIREALDRFKQGTGIVPPAAVIMLLFLPLFSMGCHTSLDTTGVYGSGQVALGTNSVTDTNIVAAAQADGKILYQVDSTIVQVKADLDDFLNWELFNRSALTPFPEVGKVANAIRQNAKQWFAAAIQTRETYAAHPTSQTQSAMLTALAVMTTALSQAQALAAQHQASLPSHP